MARAEELLLLQQYLKGNVNLSFWYFYLILIRKTCLYMYTSRSNKDFEYLLISIDLDYALLVAANNNGAFFKYIDDI